MRRDGITPDDIVHGADRASRCAFADRSEVTPADPDVLDRGVEQAEHANARTAADADLSARYSIYEYGIELPCDAMHGQLEDVTARTTFPEDASRAA